MTAPTTTVTPIYTASATASGDGRNGRSTSSDGVLDVELAIPTEMGGPGGPKTNPEQLFAAGYAACYHSALKGVARTQKVAIADTAVIADVTLNRIGDAMQLSVDLHVEMSGVDQAQGEKLADLAHQRCPYSRAISGNVDVVIDVTTA